MSHRTGKIEILGILDNEIYFKYHQAKDRKRIGKIFKRLADEKAGWLDDLHSSSVKSTIATSFIFSN
jgi:hypothetical protein